MAVSHIAHDVIVGDDNILANNVMIAGHVQIGNKVFLGGGTAIHQFTHVGDFAMSQGNSTLTQDVPSLLRRAQDQPAFWAQRHWFATWWIHPRRS